ncbi:MAG: S1C family serine protease [Dehalococcoidia bacterium]
MSSKTKYILAAVIVVTVTLVVTVLAFSLPQASSPPQSNNSTAYTNPGWTFPPNSEPATLLPDFPPVIAKARPSVVSVTTETVTSDFFGREYTESIAGSGILIDGEGYIATNNHVVESADNIYIELADGRTYSANIVGNDPLSDLAVIKIDGTNLPHAQWGNSSSLDAGEWVLAIGNALGEGITVTQGIVSRLNESVNVEGITLYGLIQTTAAVNPGNSGGPLVNMSGEVIGITSVKIVASDVESVGYAISSDVARPIISELIRDGRVTYPWLGVGLRTVNPLIAAAKGLYVDRGALIVEILAGSPADAAGLREDDVIMRFGGQEISDVADLVRAIRRSEIGQDIEILFVRGSDTKTTSARLIERPTQ